MIDQKKGDKKFKAAKEQITLSVLNWSKDYPSAASMFEEAFKIFKECGAYTKCISTLKQLIVCNEKMVDPWAVARNYESMVDLFIEKIPQTETQAIIKAAKDCFVQFRMAESFDKGLQVIGRVNKFLAARGEQQQGLEILKQVYQIALEEKSFKKKEMFHTIIESLLDSNMYEEAIKMYYEHIKANKGQDCQSQGLIILILLLILGEPKRAQNQMFELGNMYPLTDNRIPEFLTSNECEAAENLIRSYKKGEAEKFKKETTVSAVTTLFPLIIIRHLRNVVVPSAEVYENADEIQKKEIKQKILF